MKLLVKILSILIVIFITSSYAFSQNRMLNTRSNSELSRRTNPGAVNSVGKIEGNEVKRQDYIRPKYREDGSDVQQYAEPTPMPEFDFDKGYYIENSNISKF